MDQYDVCIVGAGIVGCAIARELAKYNLKICLLEKADDVSSGTTKANSAIVHGGYAAKHGSLKATFSHAGNRMYRKLDEELNFGFADIGSYVIGFNKQDEERIAKEYENGHKNGVESLEIIPGDVIKEREPNLNRDITVALHCKTAGITSPYNFAIALAENAVTNGVKLFLNSPVLGIEKQKDGFVVSTQNMVLQSKRVINAAGLCSDKVAKMLGACDFIIKPRKGQYLLFDKTEGDLVKSVIFQTPTPVSKGILVTKTFHGNLLIGPDAEDVMDKSDLATKRENIQKVVATARKSLPDFDMRKVITSFAGNRAACDRGDFIIEESLVKGFINVAGIESPGLTAAPAIAVRVKEIVAETGIELKENPEFNPYRKPYNMIADLDQTELNELIKKDPRYGRIICRCENVSEGEIVEVLKGPIPINSLDAVKRRVRARMGRCQGGFCTPRLLEIIHRELNMPVDKITKKGQKSEIVIGRTK